MSCDFYRNEGHNYLEYPLAQPDEETDQVNWVNDEPSFMSNPLYELYPEDSPESQEWVQG
jgi:hypothetical protein